jgi:uncharacterized membrane protein YheB (UPF0754 family)
MEDKQLNSTSEPKSEFIKHAGSKTKELGQKTLDLLKTHLSQQLPQISSEKPVHTPPPPSNSQTRTIQILKVFPPFLAGLFILARFWDFNGMEFYIGDSLIQLQGLLTMISVSGLIGYLTNWVAITMLFKPKFKRPILGQGLIPAQKNRIAYRLAQAVSTDLINPEIIKQKLLAADLIGIYRRKFVGIVHSVISNESFRDELKSIVTNYVSGLVEDPEIRAGLAKDLIEKFEKSLNEKSIEKIALKTYMMMRGDQAQHIISNAIASLPQNLEKALDTIDHSLDKIPSLLEAKSEDIEEWVSKTLFSILQQFDVHQLVEENVQRFDEDRISNLIKGTTNEQFQYIQYLGALLGMIGGFVIWQPVWATIVIGLLIVSVWGLDVILLKKKTTSNKHQ